MKTGTTLLCTAAITLVATAAWAAGDAAAPKADAPAPKAKEQAAKAAALPTKANEQEVKAGKAAIERAAQELARIQAEAAKAPAGSPLAAAYERYLKAWQADLDVRKKQLGLQEAGATRDQFQAVQQEMHKSMTAVGRASSALEARRAAGRYADDKGFETRKAQIPAELQDKVAARTAARQAAVEAWTKLAEGATDEAADMDLRRLKLKASVADQQARLADSALSMAMDEKQMEAQLSKLPADEVKNGKLREIKDLNAKVLAADQAAAEAMAKRQEAELDRELASQLLRRLMDEARKNAAPAPKKEGEPRKDAPPAGK